MRRQERLPGCLVGVVCGHDTNSQRRFVMGSLIKCRGASATFFRRRESPKVFFRLRRRRCFISRAWPPSSQKGEVALGVPGGTEKTWHCGLALSRLFFVKTTTLLSYFSDLSSQLFGNFCQNFDKNFPRPLHTWLCSEVPVLVMRNKVATRTLHFRKFPEK